MRFDIEIVKKIEENIVVLWCMCGYSNRICVNTLLRW